MAVCWQRIRTLKEKWTWRKSCTRELLWYSWQFNLLVFFVSPHVTGLLYSRVTACTGLFSVGLLLQLWIRGDCLKCSLFFIHQGSFPLPGLVLQSKNTHRFADAVVLLFTLYCDMCSSSSSLICWMPYSCVLNAHHVLTRPLPGWCPSSCLEKDHLPLIICAYWLWGAGRYMFFLCAFQSSPVFLETEVCWPWPRPWAVFWKWLCLTVVVFKMHISDNSRKKKPARWIILCLGEHASRNMMI